MWVDQCSGKENAAETGVKVGAKYDRSCAQHLYGQGIDGARYLHWYFDYCKAMDIAVSAP